mmetsp:Transcript_31503/g.58086  ORF Transcript_31503/g.58086 Transcript_31503/m.58086 type:complete len:85 (+) Transcript_31503:197-451(+)
MSDNEATEEKSKLERLWDNEIEYHSTVNDNFWACVTGTKRMDGSEPVCGVRGLFNHWLEAQVNYQAEKHHIIFGDPADNVAQDP